MNNLEGQKLTPSLAEKLIIELFVGQTAQLQEIRTKVEEVHAERGRLPPTVKYSPVSSALRKLKESGLAENPQLGVWSIPIRTLDDFIKWAKKFKENEYVFRGVSNEAHGIRASASLRPDEKEQPEKELDVKKRNFERFLHINKDLIRKAQQRGYDKKDGTELNVLDILAELQHYGAATCLIDFTCSAQIALWFACQPYREKQDERKDKEKKPGDSKKTVNGKVYAVKHKPPRSPRLQKCIEITPEFLEEDAEAKKDIGYFLKEGADSPLYYLQPKYQNHRIIAQQSVFLFGQYEFEADDECIIAEDCKENILKELHRVSGINDDKLFPDFEGFAWIHRKESSYTDLTPSAHKALGLEENNKGNFEEAVAEYDMAINKNSNDAEAYNLRGKAYFSLERYNDTLKDYNEAIRINPDYAEAYFNRGMLNDERKKYEDAISDFTKALSLKPNYDDALFHRGRMNFLLNQNVKALDDFSEVIKLDSDSASAYCFRGIVRNELEQYHAAIRDLTKSINLDNTLILSYYERANANFFLGRSEEATSDLEKALALGKEQNNDEFLPEILDLLNEIDSYTIGGSQNEE